MKILNYLKSLFKKNESYIIPNLKDKNLDYCQKCVLMECDYRPMGPNPCDFELTLIDYDPNKETLLIIDDNPGIISFLEDDINLLSMMYNAPDINIMTISGVHCAFELHRYLKEHSDFKIKYAIIDITYGGTKYSGNESVKFNGVDVFEMIQSDDLKYLFYTGNNLNPYIKSNLNMINKFKELTGEELQDHVVFKTSMNMESRQKELAKILFDIEI